MLPIEERPVEFYSSGLRLSGVLYLPREEAPAGGRPGIVLCNGFTTVKELYLPPLARAMGGAGFAALTFDYRGFGQSEGAPGRLIPEEEVHDARNAMTFVQSQPGIDARRLGLFGTSFGGGIAIAVAAADARARAVVSSVPVCNGERWLRGMRPYWEWVELCRRVEADRARRVLTGTSERVDRSVIAPPDPAAQRTHGAQPPRPALVLETAEAIMEFNPEALVDRLSPRPFLMIVAAQDTRVPPDVSVPAFERAREPKSLVVLDGIAHHDVYELPARERLLEIVLPWFRTHLASGASSPRVESTGSTAT